MFSKNVRIRKEVREDIIEERSYNERRRELVAFERGDYMSGHHWSQATHVIARPLHQWTSRM